MAKDTAFSIAIGIGETYCRLVFCNKHDFQRKNTMMSIEWFNSIRKRPDNKTPNTLLLNLDKSFHSFGDKAKINYANITKDEKEDQSTYYYFRNLQDLKNISKGTKIQDETGKMILVFDVFVHLIRSMKEECSRLDIDDSFLRFMMFTITFPARWGSNAKSCIREAAEKAGITRDNLIVVQEPVVAALSCHYAESDQIDSFYKAVMSGASYIVVDLGGRCGNISYHQHYGFLRKLLQTGGRALGGKCVTDEFLKFLGQVYGEKTLQQVKEERPDVYETIIDGFENRQCFISAEGQGKLNFAIPLEIKSKIIECRFAGSVKATGDKLRISKVHVRQWFEKTLAAIEIGLERILHHYQLERAEYILMVGEFSKSEYVQSSIRKMFPQKKVIVPYDPQLAVIKGAASFIFISETMNSKARCTYGVQHWPEFEKSVHPLDKLVVIDGVIRCKDVFFKYIERDDQIPKDKRISHVCTLLTSGSDTVEYTVYASCHPDPKFTDEEGCIVLGVLQTPFTVDGEVVKVEIEQTLIFGETCITLQAKHMETGQVCETQMEYM